jgi:pimeloyl-ACP methyl ester carboxylesterase
MPDDSDQRLQLVQLLDYPREDVGIELKNWLDLSVRAIRADLAKDLLALANFGGGYLAFGFEERPEGWFPSGSNPFAQERYSQDSINTILARHAEPVFECRVHHVKSSIGDLHVIIEISGGHTVPIRSKNAPNGSDLRSDIYYVRLPGPMSSSPQSGRDWDELIKRCVENNRSRFIDDVRRLLEAFRKEPELVAELTNLGPDVAGWSSASSARLTEKLASEEDDLVRGRLTESYTRGTWSCAYIIESVPILRSLPSFKEILRDVRGNETGWPPWITIDQMDEMRAYDAGGVLECWLSKSGDLDFWRADPHGRMFIIRRLQEDQEFKGVEPGTFFDLTLPVWRVGECLLHFERLAERLGAENARFLFEWNGIQGRVLESRADPRRSLSYGRRSRVPTVRSEISVSASAVRDGLPDLLRMVLTPLYSAFDLFEAPLELFSSVSNQLRGQR